MTIRWLCNVGIEEKRGNCYLHWLWCGGGTCTIYYVLLNSDISPPFRHCIITRWSLTLISYECITISSLLLHSDISPPFWHLVKPLKNSQFWRPKKWMWGLQKKVIPRIHIGMAFLQKTGSKLVKFGPCGPTYILPGHIGGRHPVPCLSTQIAERQGTAMYYFFSIF